MGVKIINLLDSLLNIPCLSHYLHLHPVGDDHQVNVYCEHNFNQIPMSALENEGVRGDSFKRMSIEYAGYRDSVQNLSAASRKPYVWGNSSHPCGPWHRAVFDPTSRASPPSSKTQWRQGEDLTAPWWGRMCTTEKTRDDKTRGLCPLLPPPPKTDMLLAYWVR